MTNRSNGRISGLYAITPDEPDTTSLLRKVGLALEGGARIIQYRNKTATGILRMEQALALRELTRGFSATFIVNDDALLARQSGADGVHIGADDVSPQAARAILGDGKLVGISCYNRLDLACWAVQEGADYVAFGSFFASTVKPDAVAAEPELLHQARVELDIPLVAIGGITALNGSKLIEAGADALAVISSVFGASDIRQAAQDFSQLFFIRKT